MVLFCTILSLLPFFYIPYFASFAHTHTQFFYYIEEEEEEEKKMLYFFVKL